MVAKGARINIAEIAHRCDDYTLAFTYLFRESTDIQNIATSDSTSASHAPVAFVEVESIY